MLVPAIVYKDEIEKQFAKRMYDDDMFYYQGYAHGHEITEIKPQDNLYQWAIVGKGPQHGSIYDVTDGSCSPIYDDKLIGYFAYRIDPNTNNVYNFGLISFDKGNPLVAKDVFDKIKELILNHHRVEWRCIGGNPALRGYKNFIKRINRKYNLQCKMHFFTDVVKDNQGMYRDEVVFEVVNNDV